MNASEDRLVRVSLGLHRRLARLQAEDQQAQRSKRSYGQILEEAMDAYEELLEEVPSEPR